MVPILLCSIVAAAICVERMWSLQRSRIVPKNLLAQIWSALKSADLDSQKLRELRANSPLGQILAAGIANSKRGREIMKEAMEEAASQVSHDLQRYLTTLGIIASISPLLGLLGTVVGMIKVFSAIMISGVGDANVLAGGISQALITTAAGLTVAIPSYFFYRFFRGMVAEYVISMEEKAISLIDCIERGNTSTVSYSSFEG